MSYKKRKEIIEKLEYLEQKYPVEKWALEGIHVWPVLKVKLFFLEFNSDKEIEAASVFKKIKKAWQLFTKLEGSIVEFLKLGRQKAEVVFSGAHTHRIWHQGKFINRYFDPLADYLNKKKIRNLGLEYSSLKQQAIPYSKLDLLIFFFKFRSIKTDSLYLDEKFENFLEEVEHLFPIGKQKISLLLKKNIENIISWKKLYLYVFKKVQPKYSFGLCYYCNAMWGMNAAAKELGIVSIDMQHGAQGKLHAAYSFGKAPEEGYNVLPKEFWCWDKESYEDILTWSNGSFHRSRLSGNPWFEFLLNNSKEERMDIPKGKPVILFTHQPLKPNLDDYIIESIKKTTSNYNWWIRLHPRITDKDRIELLKNLQDNGLLELVEIEKATLFPLPILLKEVSLHISKFSGSVIEAFLVGTPSIILEETGMITFEHIIEQGGAIGIEKPTADLLISGIEEGMNIQLPSLGKDLSYRQAMDEILA